MAALGHMQRADELVVLGDFNARVGCDAALGSVNWRPTRGPHSPGLLPNANGLRLYNLQWSVTSRWHARGLLPGMKGIE